MYLGQPDRPSAGTKLIRGGGLLIAAGLITLGVVRLIRRHIETAALKSCAFHCDLNRSVHHP
jgi:hypothetical protein